MTIEALQEAKRLEESIIGLQKKFEAINQPVGSIGYDSWVNIAYDTQGGRKNVHIQLPIPMVRFIHEQYKAHLLAEIHRMKHEISKL